ncbi:MAG: L-idonate 5-dehydrogenase [Gammaproteobacteria bacterium]|nr:L-idonate 5-dehydrogenase [Gammaproteobacteria bacterium]
MQAIVIHAPRDLRVDRVTIDAPGEGEAVVDISMGGICGSDLHYYAHGGFGDIRIKQPMVLGHEVAGVVAAVGDNVDAGLQGRRVSINPSRPCGRCSYCGAGLPNHCMDMRFFGSAMRFPHVQGAFQQSIVVDAQQCVPVSDSLSMQSAAFAEPLSVALHAVNRAGSLNGKRVLVAGCGPIGAAVVAATRFAGALEVVACDVTDAPLKCAQALGADRTVNVATSPDQLAVADGLKGIFDVVIEASGNEQAFRRALNVLKPRGILVQVGLGGEISIPQNVVVAKEIDVRGSFRFHEEFQWAVNLLSAGKIDISPIISHTFPVRSALDAFETAMDRSTAMKVLIDFS